MIERFSGNIIEITKDKNGFNIYCDGKLIKTVKCNIYISFNPGFYQHSEGHFYYEYHKKQDDHPSEVFMNVSEMILYLFNIPKAYFGNSEVWVMNE